MTNLPFEPKKTTGQFLTNYQKHDRAKQIATGFFLSHAIKVIDYGDDRRYERVYFEDKARPDALLWKPELQLAFADFKGHDNYNWMLNKRAYESYIKLSNEYELPAFIIWVVIPEAKIYYTKLPFSYPYEDTMPHDRNKIVKPSTIEVQPIYKLLEELSLYKQTRLLR